MKITDKLDGLSRKQGAVILFAGLFVASGTAFTLDLFGEISSEGTVEEAITTSSIFNTGNLNDDTVFTGQETFYGGNNYTYTQMVDMQSEATSTVGLGFETTYNESESGLNEAEDEIRTYHIISEGIGFSVANGSETVQQNTDTTEVSFKNFNSEEDGASVFVTSHASGESGGFGINVSGEEITEFQDVSVEGTTTVYPSHTQGVPDWVVAQVVAQNDTEISTNDASVTLEEDNSYTLVMANAGNKVNVDEATEESFSVNFDPNFIFNDQFNQDNWFAVATGSDTDSYPNGDQFSTVDGDENFGFIEDNTTVETIGLTTGSGSGEYGSEIAYQNMSFGGNEYLQSSIESVEQVTNSRTSTYNMVVGDRKQFSTVTEFGSISGNDIEISTDILPSYEVQE